MDLSGRPARGSFARGFGAAGHTPSVRPPEDLFWFRFAPAYNPAPARRPAPRGRGPKHQMTHHCAAPRTRTVRPPPCSLSRLLTRSAARRSP